MSMEKEGHFRGRACYCILIKDSENKFVFRIMSTGESFTIRQGTCIKKVNRVGFEG